MKARKNKKSTQMVIALILASGFFFFNSSSGEQKEWIMGESTGKCDAAEHEGGKSDTAAQISWPEDAPEIPEFSFGKINAVAKNSTPTSSIWSLHLSELPGSVVDDYYDQLWRKEWFAQATPMPDGRTLLGNKNEVFIFLLAFKDNTGVLVLRSKVSK